METLSVDNRNVESDFEESVRKALMELNREQQRLLRLRYFKDLNYADLADVYSVSQSAMRKRVSRALKALRQILESQQGGEKS